MFNQHIHKFLLTVALLAVIVASHFTAVIFGVYEVQAQAGFVWFDNVLHFLTGAVAGLFWFLVLNIRKPAFPRHSKIISIIIFVVVTALAWELVELIFYKTFTSHATTFKIYSPTIGEALIDILSNIVGGFVFITAAFSKGYFLKG